MKANRVFHSIDNIQSWVIRSILKHGQAAAPRGISTLELFPCSFVLSSPRRRCTTNPARRWSFPLAIGEFCWHVSGSNELDFISHYAKRWRRFSDDGLFIKGSCYGHRAFKNHPGEQSQWDRLLQLLRTDPDSRRAVLYFSDSSFNSDLNAKDVACACTQQFMIRSGRVHSFVNMRSNDVIWGLPYDVFLFTMFQELLASSLGLELGEYSHSVSSMHLYRDHLSLAKEIIRLRANDHLEMPKMVHPEQLSYFLEGEAEIRHACDLSKVKQFTFVDKYWQDLLRVLNYYRLAKANRNYGSVFSTIREFPYAALLRNSCKAGLPEDNNAKLSSDGTREIKN
jgi:thymidylate synthase